MKKRILQKIACLAFTVLFVAARAQTPEEGNVSLCSPMNVLTRVSSAVGVLFAGNMAKNAT
jgi:hypothetical protein